MITPVDLSSLTLGLSSGHRAPGLHMSTLYNAYYQEKEPKRFKKGTAPDPLRLEAGLALETVLEREIAQRMNGERPGELITAEGIYYNPDLIIFDGAITRLGEIKLTWMSCRGCPISPAQAAATGLVSNWDGTSPAILPPQFGKYLCQMKCYSFHLELLHGRLIVYFVNGNYRPPVPVLLAWDFEWTRREVEEEWLTVRNFGRLKGLL